MILLHTSLNISHLFLSETTVYSKLEPSPSYAPLEVAVGGSCISMRGAGRDVRSGTLTVLFVFRTKGGFHGFVSWGKSQTRLFRSARTDPSLVDCPFRPKRGSRCHSAPDSAPRYVALGKRKLTDRTM